MQVQPEAQVRRVSCVPGSYRTDTFHWCKGLNLTERGLLVLPWRILATKNFPGLFVRADHLQRAPNPEKLGSLEWYNQQWKNSQEAMSGQTENPLAL